MVRRVYEEVLGVEDVDDGDSFFALGGSSLLVMALLERIEEEIGVAVSLQDFFEAPTLAGLRLAVERARVDVRPADLAALLAAAAAAGAPQRPAIAGPDGTVSYAQLAELVCAAACAPVDRPAEPEALRVATTVAGARELLTRLAATRPTLLLAPDAPAAEERQAMEAFAADPGDGEEGGVHAIVTSGSTGRPKVVVRANARAYALRPAQAALYGLGPDEHYLVTTPLHYSYGLKSGLLTGVLSGATVVLPPPAPTPASLSAWVERHPIGVAVGVSYAYRLLLAGGAPLPALHTAIVGGDPLPGHLARAWHQSTGVPLMDGYGSSETDHVSANTDLVAGSVGRPLPGVEVRVRAEGTAPAAAGVGELLVRSPGLARGYAADPRLTAERFRAGWYHTGDLAELREDGHLFLRGRLDDQLNVAGTKVDPREVEAACREALGLHDCAVVGREGARGHVEVCAYVVAARPVGRADVVRELADRLSAHKIPTRVVQLDALPRGANGKLRPEELPR